MSRRRPGSPSDVREIGVARLTAGPELIGVPASIVGAVPGVGVPNIGARPKKAG